MSIGLGRVGVFFKLRFGLSILVFLVGFVISLRSSNKIKIVMKGSFFRVLKS